MNRRRHLVIGLSLLALAACSRHAFVASGFS
jgi:hypothetical protein